jgi:hypothetical protein
MGVMDDLSVFDKLVHDLSGFERQDMLDRIRAGVAEDAQPGVPPEEPPSIDLETEYHKLGVFRRLLVLLSAFFTGRDRVHVMEQMLLRSVARRAREAMPETLHPSRRELLPQFANVVAALASDARSYSPALAHSLGRERNGFIAFLFGLQSPALQDDLLSATNLDQIAQREPTLSDYSVKKQALSALEDGLSVVSPAARQKMYHDVRLLHHLYALSSFSFDRLIAQFEGIPGVEAQDVPLSRLADDLGRLASIARGLWRSPSPALLEALCLYEYQDALTADDGEARIEERLQTLQRSAAGIRAFVEQYPLGDLVRLAHSSINYAPGPISGGEDWFAQLKSFWRDRIEQSYRRFTYQRKQSSLLKCAAELLETGTPEPLPGYPPSGPDQQTRHATSVGVLHETFGTTFRENVLTPLALVFRDGQFYKPDNRKEFDGAFQELDRIQTDIANLASRLRPQGDFGARLAQVDRSDMLPEIAAERRRTIHAAIDNVAEGIVSRAIGAFRLLVSLLAGILYGEVGGRYDTLSNISDLGGRNNPAVIRRLETCHGMLKNLADTVAELYNLETLSRDA